MMLLRSDLSAERGKFFNYKMFYRLDQALTE